MLETGCNTFSRQLQSKGESPKTPSHLKTPMPICQYAKPRTICMYIAPINVKLLTLVIAHDVAPELYTTKPATAANTISPAPAPVARSAPFEGSGALSDVELPSVDEGMLLNEPVPLLSAVRDDVVGSTGAERFPGRVTEGADIDAAVHVVQKLPPDVVTHSVAVVLMVVGAAEPEVVGVEKETEPAVQVVQELPPDEDSHAVRVVVSVVGITVGALVVVWLGGAGLADSKSAKLGVTEQDQLDLYSIDRGRKIGLLTLVFSTVITHYLNTVGRLTSCIRD